MRKTTACAIISTLPWALAQSTAAIIPVTGVSTGINPLTLARPARKSITTLYSEKTEEWDLYIQALAAMQATPESDPRSYYAIAGIHGIPYQPWNGVDGWTNNNTGYCTHSNIQFASWHRPYMALFEQIVVGHAVDIANTYPGSTIAAYQSAAATLRIPFWDWASEFQLPEAVIPENVTVNGPQGATELPNPLYAYHFQTMPSWQASDIGEPTMQTVRCPVSTSDLTTNVTEADEEIQASASNVRSYVYDAFTRSEEFAGMACFCDYSTTGSFELPHNVVHNIAGCEHSTLANIFLSAFDPMFFLLHANVDRLVALWQAINYENSVLNSTGESKGTLGTAPGTILTPQSPLKPFYADQETFWTSVSASSIKTFGYTYPEINDWSTKADNLSAYVRNQVNSLYGQGQSSTKRAIRRRGRGKKAVSSQKYYTVELSVDRSELTLPCSIQLLTQGKHLARVDFLGLPTTGMAKASVPIVDSLSTHGLASMAVDSVIPHLQDNLEVKIIQRNGSQTPTSAVRSLQIQAQSLDYVPRERDSDFPTFGKAKLWAMKGKSAAIP